MGQPGAVLCLVGCTSAAPGVPELSLLTVHGPELSGIEHVDIGLYGLCIRTSHSLDCRPTAGYDIGALVDSFHPPPNGTISPNLYLLLETSLRLQSRVLVSPLPGAGVAFSLALVFWYLKRRADPEDGGGKALPRWSGRLFWLLAAISFTLALGAALCTTVVVGAAVFVSGLAPPDSPLLVDAYARHVVALEWVVVCLVLFFMLLAKERCGKSEADAAPVLPITEKKKKRKKNGEGAVKPDPSDSSTVCGGSSSDGTLTGPFGRPPAFPGHKSDMAKQVQPPSKMQPPPRPPGRTPASTLGGPFATYCNAPGDPAPGAPLQRPAMAVALTRQPTPGHVSEAESTSSSASSQAPSQSVARPADPGRKGKVRRFNKRLADQPAPRLPHALQQIPQGSFPARPRPSYQADARTASSIPSSRPRSIQTTPPPSVRSQGAATGTSQTPPPSEDEVRAWREHLEAREHQQDEQVLLIEEAQARLDQRAQATKRARHDLRAQEWRVREERLAIQAERDEDERARQARQAQAEKDRSRAARAQRSQDKMQAARATLDSALFSRQLSRRSQQAAQAAAPTAPHPVPGLLVTEPTFHQAESDPDPRGRAARPWDDKTPERSMSVQPGSRGADDVLQRTQSMSSGRKVKIDPTLRPRSKLSE
ncbi:hypothetical protein GGTG_09132 [Gaeumannomyces tritici R3-111a-1]|uniref:Uncharacterized protein n=1 Tax=Gaeumannomyces tritici (strain R3-111a-1) TaxID=644352 RepID=J3P6J1_GAET3|nr:hypothetical protein GGTG_09132 [Gaeumannomyces tritici R3-111a-1]EJT72266.1 hypothetical protein GGTG_09132 [Gaeumannomyces tritici R3-111a-1]